MILHSQIIGQGIPFVILHGFLGMGDNWKSLGNRFAEAGYEVHLLDQRNHGRSFTSDDFSYEVMAEDLKRYCAHYHLNEIILLGHSMGGKTAMLFATMFPEMVKRLLVADIGPKEYPHHYQEHEILKALSLLDFNKIKTREDANELLSEYIKDSGTRQFLLKNLYWVNKGELGFRINLPVLTEKNSEIGKSLPENAVFQGNTLFLRGAKSSYIDRMDETLIKNHFPNSEIVTVSNAGHWLHAENPNEFYSNVVKFL